MRALVVDQAKPGGVALVEDYPDSPLAAKAREKIK